MDVLDEILSGKIIDPPKSEPEKSVMLPHEINVVADLLGVTPDEVRASLPGAEPVQEKASERREVAPGRADRSVLAPGHPGLRRKKPVEAKVHKETNCWCQEWLTEVDPQFLKVLTARQNGPMPHSNRTFGPQQIKWLEKNAVLGEGDKYGKPVRMLPFQRALFWKLFEIRDNGSRRFRNAVLCLGKGSGKTPVGGWIGDLEIAGPSVFDKWLADGRPKAKRRESADVIIIASSYEQADMMIDEMRVTFDEGPLKEYAASAKGWVKLKNGLRGIARRIPATPKKADGTKATALLVDEAHELTSERQETAYDVASGGTAKRADSIVCKFSTAGNDLNTMFGREWSRGNRGEFDEDELFVYMSAEDGLDPTDDADIEKGIKQANPLAAAGIANIRDLVRKFKSMPAFRAKRYFWNRWVPTDESWLPEGAWDACKGTVEFDLSLPVFVGADMAMKRDSCSVVLLQKQPNGKILAEAKVWMPDGDLINQDEVDAYIISLTKKYDVIWTAGDEHYWITLPQLEKGDPERGIDPIKVLRVPQSGKNMILAYARTYKAIVDRVIVHAGAPDFSDQITSAAPHSTDGGWTVKKGRNKRRIDSTPALASAIFAMSAEAPEEEEQQFDWVSF